MGAQTVTLSPFPCLQGYISFPEASAAPPGHEDSKDPGSGPEALPCYYLSPKIYLCPV